MKQWILVWMMIMCGLQIGHGQAIYDVVVSEVMADPLPVVALPNVEYVELYNRSDHDIDLFEMKLAIGNDTTAFKVHRMLKSRSFLIVSKTSATELSSYGNFAGLTNFPSLGNDGDTIVLLNAAGKVVHAMYFDPVMQENSIKANGGWSYELSDTSHPWKIEGNYVSSHDPAGGTPGKMNSTDRRINDHEPPAVSFAFMPSDRTIIIQLDESVDHRSAENIAHVQIEPSWKILSMKALPPFFDKLSITLAEPISSGMILKLRINGISDNDGNMNDGSALVKAAMALPLRKGEIVINEIYFDPPTPGTDFIEIYNRSEHAVDLHATLLATRDGIGKIKDAVLFSSRTRFLYPGELAVCTRDQDWLRSAFSSSESVISEVSSMPAFGDDDGSVLITDVQGSVIDEVHYFSSWHDPFVINKEGISLERLDPSSTSDKAANWASASSLVKGTPGRMNSQFLTANPHRSISLNLKIFSPDNDGFDDQLLINFKFDLPGMMANVKVYNEVGVLQHIIANNELLGTSGWLRWNGANRSGNVCSPGLYVIEGIFHHASGKVVRYREAVVVAKR